MSSRQGESDEELSEIDRQSPKDEDDRQEEDDDEPIDDEEEEDEGLPISERFEKEKFKLKQAKKTISQLLSNIQDYKKVLEQEKEDLRLDLKSQYLTEIERLEAEKMELEELAQEQQAAITEIEDEKGRKNKENMENLQTLLKEMSIIEEANDAMAKELEGEKSKHDNTKDQLETTTQIMQQLEIKIEMQEKQMSKLQKMQFESNTRQSSESYDPKVLEQLKGMQDDSLRGEVLKLRKQIQEEKQKREKIDTLLSQARKISSEGAEKTEGGGNTASSELKDQLDDAKSAHDKTKKMLDEERQNVMSYKQQVEKLNKRIRDLIQAQTTAFHELEEERKKAPPGESSASLMARRPTVAALNEARRPTIAMMGERSTLNLQPTKDRSMTVASRSPLLTQKAGSPALNVAQRSTPVPTNSSSPAPGTPDKDAQKGGNILKRLSIRKASQTDSGFAVSEPSNFKHVGSAFTKKLQESQQQQGTSPAPTSQPTTPSLTTSQQSASATSSNPQPASVTISRTPSIEDHGKTVSRTSSTSSVSSLKTSLDSKSMPNWTKDVEGEKKLEIARQALNAGKLVDEKIETGKILGSTHKSPIPMPEGWEEHLDSTTKVYYLNHATECATRKHPLAAQLRQQGEGAKIAQIFTTLGQRSQITAKYDRKHEQKAIVIQKYGRMLIWRRRYKVYLELAKMRDLSIKELVKAETSFSASVAAISKHFQDPSAKKIKTVNTVATLLQAIITCSNIMLDLLKQRSERWFFWQKGGDILMLMVPQLENYTKYAAALQDPTFQPDLQKYLASTMTKGKASGASFAMDLPSLLEVPLQHLPKYKRSVETLLKTTWKTNPDYDALYTVYARVRSTTDQIEESVKLRRNSENMDRVKRMLHGNVPDLWNTKDRVFIREGNLVKLENGSPKKRFFILFSDLLVWGEKDESGSRVKYRNNVSLSGNSSVRDLPKGKSDGTEYGIELVTQTRNVQLYFDNEILKKSWMDAFASLVKQSSVTFDPQSEQPQHSLTTSGGVGKFFRRTFSASTGERVKEELKQMKAEEAAKQSGTVSPTPGNQPSPTEESPTMVDKDAQNCSICNSAFSMMKRKHHCRKCNRPVCGNCSNNKMKINGTIARACDDCFNTTSAQPKPNLPARYGTIRRQKSAGSIATLYSLPSSVLQKIFSFMNARELALMSRVCTLWKNIIDDDKVWKPSFLSRWNYPGAIVGGRTWKERYKIETNWMKGKYWNYTLQGHTAAITSLHFQERHLVSGSLDMKLLLWDLNTRKVARVMPGHLGSVRCVDLALSQDSIYSGSDDKTVKLWSFETGKLLKTLREHAGEVNCMQAEPDKNILVTGSNDQTIKIFDTRSWKVNQLFKSKDKVYCLQKYNDLLVSGGQDKIIRLWDVRTGAQPLAELKGHTESIKSIQFNEDQILSGADDGTVRIWDLKEGRRSIVAHKDAKVTCLEFDGNKIVSGSSDTTIKTWDLESGNLMHTIEAEKGSRHWVRCLQFIQETLITGHGDNSIRVWTFFDESKSSSIAKEDD